MTLTLSLSDPVHREFMAQALDLAKQAATMGEVPVGCVVVDPNGRVVGTGFNERETRQDPTAHAEMIAITAAAKSLGRWRLHDCRVYVTLEPCVMCAGALWQARIQYLIYAAKDPKAGAVDSLYTIPSDHRLNHRFPAVSGLLQEESAELLRNFFKAKRISMT